MHALKDLLRAGKVQAASLEGLHALDWVELQIHTFIVHPINVFQGIGSTKDRPSICCTLSRYAPKLRQLRHADFLKGIA
jgi:hypothetical protein